jgi:hypothetical protein
MKDVMRNVVVFGILIAVSIGLGGCGFMLQDMVLNGYPTYAETKTAWGTIPPEYGRVVIIYPQNVTEQAVVGLISLSGTIKVDGMPERQIGVPIGPKTFVFADLPAGKHSLYGLHKDVKEFDVPAGEVSYIDVKGCSMNSQEAELLLKKMHHNFKKALPFEKQINEGWTAEHAL